MIHQVSHSLGKYAVLLYKTKKNVALDSQIIQWYSMHINNQNVCFAVLIFLCVTNRKELLSNAYRYSIGVAVIDATMYPV